jgi:hypothetical protein
VQTYQIGFRVALPSRAFAGDIPLDKEQESFGGNVYQSLFCLLKSHSALNSSQVDHSPRLFGQQTVSRIIVAKRFGIVYQGSLPQKGP